MGQVMSGWNNVKAFLIPADFDKKIYISITAWWIYYKPTTLL